MLKTTLMIMARAVNAKFGTNAAIYATIAMMFALFVLMIFGVYIVTVFVLSWLF